MEALQPTQGTGTPPLAWLTTKTTAERLVSAIFSLPSCHLFLFHFSPVHLEYKLTILQNNKNNKQKSVDFGPLGVGGWAETQLSDQWANGKGFYLEELKNKKML